MLIRDLRVTDASTCDGIIASLPHFFGDPHGIAECAQAVRGQRGWVAEVDGTVRGFLTVDFPLPSAPEITWMAVRQDRRRGGLGRALIERAATALNGAPVLSVLTLAASVAQEGTDTYAGTRAFYQAMGFVPVREIHPPGWRDPALLLVLALQHPQ
jgi:GNAT superfamily N-acetyltransferase